MEKERDFIGKLGIAAERYGKEGEYWLSKLSGELKKSSFPHDYSPNNKDEKPLATVEFQLSNSACKRLSELSKGLEHRLFMILSANLAVLLHKYTGDTDIIIGSPILKQEIEGEFINTVLALRTPLEDHLSFKEFLLNVVRPTVIEANDHQNYPIETLAFKLNMPTTPNEFSLFSVAVLLENIHEKKYIQYLHPEITFSFLHTNEQIRGIVEYNAAFYDSSTIERIKNHYIRLIDEVVQNINTSISEINILSHDEKSQLLVEFNNTKTNYPAEKTIDDIFTDYSMKNPNEPALTFEGEPQSYRELNEKASALAYYLHQIGVKPQEPVGILIKDSPVMITAILGILKAGGIYLPIAVDAPEKRINYVLTDCNTKIVLTNFQPPTDIEIQAIQIDNPEIFNQSQSLNRKGNSSDPAYIMYTSGSTGTPKGVIVEHRSVIRLVKETNYIEFHPGDSILLTGALEFDASTFEIWGSLLNGLILHLVPTDTILNYEHLKNIIRKNKVTTMWMTSPLFNQVLDMDIDVFTGLKHLLVGGDVLSPLHIQQLQKRYPEITITNGYGPTENTTFSLTHRITKQFKENIPIGKPIGNSTAYILDCKKNLVPIGVPGELYVGGDGLSRGYLNNPELTAEKFLSLRIDQFSGRVYKTGDSARWQPDGNVQFLGRIDYQVKIRGYRIEPGEIERQLEQIEGIKEAVVIDRKNRDGEKYLCAYFVASESGKKGENDLDVVNIKKILSKQLPDYMVPAYFTQLEEIPLKSSGKVNRDSLPKPEIVNIGTAYIAPRNQMEEILVDIWSTVLGVSKETIGIDSDFFELGGHSLRATILISKIHKALEVKIPLAELFRAPNIRDLAEYIKSLKKEKFSHFNHAEKKEYYHLSAAQKRMFIVHKLGYDGIGYNVTMAVLLEGNWKLQMLHNAFNELILRHESLRTSFEILNETPIQRIHNDLEFKIDYYENKEETTSPLSSSTKRDEDSIQVIKKFIRPFDLSQAPLFRVGLINKGTNRNILIVDMHHIITDGTSMDLMIKEFFSLYMGENQPPLIYQYIDYVEWQNSKEQKAAAAKQENFWLTQFADEIPVLNLPTDYPRPAVQSFEGKSIDFEISKEQTQVINDLALKTGTTLYMILLAAYNILLSKISGQEDIVIGTPIAARRHTDLERIIGMFVNTLALRNLPVGTMSFIDFLAEIKQNTLNAFENQEFQFEELVEKLVINRDPSRNPLFDVVFVLQNMEAQAEETHHIESTDLALKPYKYGIETSKFDLTLTCFETPSSTISFVINYCTALFNSDSINRIGLQFNSILSTLIEAPNRKLSTIEIISQEERHRILYDFNDTSCDYPHTFTVNQLIEKQVEKVPDNIACEAGAQITYNELNRKSNQLANFFYWEKNIQPDDRIGMLMEKNIACIITMLGIQKAGACYVPIDPHYPEKRILEIIRDANIKTMCTQTQFLKTVFSLQQQFRDIQTALYMDKWDGPEIAKNAINPDVSKQIEFENYDCTKILSNHSHQNPPAKIEPHHLLYIIYTSGSTGKPKGVMIDHHNIVRLMKNDRFLFDFNSNDVWTMFHSYNFDFSVWEMYGALVYGGKVIVISLMMARDTNEFLQLLTLHKVSVLNQTPSAFYRLIDETLNQEDTKLNLKYVIFGGEALSPRKLKKWYEKYPSVKLINMYGITETTVHVTYKEITSAEIDRDSKSIGVPLPTLKTYIINKYLHLQPIGAAGEIVVGGEGVARGYQNRPEFTQEKFIYADILRNNTAKENQIPHHHKTNREILYKTGDLGRFSANGELVYLGRIDNQVKIRGFRIELGEIESHIRNHEAVKEAVVISNTDTFGDTFLCAYLVLKKNLSTSVFRPFLAKKIPEYMIPSYFIPIDSIPLTSNGKLDKKSLPVLPRFENGDANASPRDKIEKTLVRIWADVLHTDKKNININTNFFEAGGHSLKATILISNIHKELEVKIPLGEVFRTPTIRELSQYVREATAREQFQSLETVEQKEYYLLSSAQKRYYILQQMKTNDLSYNIPQIVELEGKINKEKLEEICRKLILRHDSLRTSFDMINSWAVQRVHPYDEVSFVLEYSESDEASVTKHIQEFIRGFDLTHPPLFRLGLIKLETERYILMLDMNHLISDGVSYNIFINDFMTLYKGETPERLRFQYIDFAHWQNTLIQSGKMKKQEEYWKERFKGEIPVLNMPVDFPEKISNTFEGSSVYLPMDRTLTDRITQMALETGTTLNMVLLAAYNILLSRYTGQEDIIIGSLTSGRNHADFQQIIGLFLNSLALRNFPNKNKTFTEFLNEVKENTINDYANQDYQYDDLVSLLGITQEGKKGGLFDTLFTCQDIEPPEIKIPGLTLRPYGYKNETAKFDLYLDALVRGDTFDIIMKYSSVRYKRSTIEKILENFIEILEQICKNQEIILQDITISTGLVQISENQFLEEDEDFGI